MSNNFFDNEDKDLLLCHLLLLNKIVNKSNTYG